MAFPSVVIKVKYGDTLRRFNALVNEDQQLDLDMERLRMKICSLFNFTPDADFIVTYIDEDDDQVTLADDEDLYDVMRQGLNPVRITVHLNSDKSVVTSAKSTEGSTPREPSSQTPHQNINPRVADILKSVPEPLTDALSKLYLELASKAASTSPVLADLINNLSKMGQPYLNASHSPSGTSTGSSHEFHDNLQNASAIEEHGAPVEEGMKPGGVHVSTFEQQAPMSSQVSMEHAVKDARVAEPIRPPQQLSLNKGKNPNFGYFPYMPVGDGIKKDEIPDNSAGKSEANTGYTKLPIGDSMKKDKGINGDFAGRSGVYELLRAQFPKHPSSKPETDKANPAGNQFESALFSNSAGVCPFSGVPLQPTRSNALYMPAVQPFKRSFNDSADGIGSIFHTGVRCDGCGVLPITGPRFKSKVKHDYDLCSICFSRIGNDSDYAKIDFPLPYRHPWTCKGFYDPMFAHLPSMQVPSMTRPYGAKHHHSRLDSCFIMDVNVMDGTSMAPSTPFTKIWRMRNNGTIPWVRGLQLLWIGGDRFSASDSVEIEIPLEGVNVGSEIDIAVDFIAPELPGRYISYWRMAQRTGHKFGQRVWVLIQVEAALEDSTRNCSPVLKSDLPPENAGSLAHESSPVMDLNLPAGNAASSAGGSSRVESLNLGVNVEPTGGVEAGGDLSSSAPKEGESSMVEQKHKRTEIEDMNFPINDDLLVASDGSCLVKTSSSSSTPSPSRTDISDSFPVPLSQTANSNIDANVPKERTSSSSPPSPLRIGFPASVPAFSHIAYSDVDANVPQKPSIDASSSVPPYYSSETPKWYCPDADGQSNPASFYPSVSNPQYSSEAPQWYCPVPDPKPASASPSVSYPIIDMSGQSSITSSTGAKDDYKRNYDQVYRENGVEETLLKELEEMGFEQVELNKEVLRMNDYDFERSLDDLCGGYEWDPILEELKEMGFEDKETNRKLLVKNNGSLTRVVMDLISGEKA